MKLGWILASVVLLALLVSPFHAAEDKVADEFSVVNESDPVEWKNLGNSLYNLGRIDEAIDAYNRAIALDPQYTEAWFNKGVALSKFDDLNYTKEAIEAYNRTVALDPQYTGAWFNKGVALYDLNHTKEAIEAYDEAINLDRNNATFWNHKGIALRKIKQFDKAIEAYNRAIRLNQTDAKPWHNLGNVLFDDLKDFDKAVEAYDKATELDSNYTLAWHHKGMALFALERYDEALEAYNKYDEALKAYNKSDEDLEAYNKSIEHAEILYEKGNVLFALERYDEALETYNKSIKINSTDPYYWNNKGNALAELKKYDEALEAYNNSIRYWSERHDLQNNTIKLGKAAAWNGKGNVFSEQKRYNDSIKAYEEAIKLSPNNAAIWNNKGHLMFEQRRYNESLELYNEALQLDSNNSIIWYNKGDVLENLNRSAEAAMAYSLGRERELSTDTKMGIFVAFLFAFSALAASGYMLSRRSRKYTTSIVILSVNLLGFLTVMWVLSGLFDVPLVGQFLAGGSLMILITAALWSFSGFPLYPWMAQLVLAIEDFDRKCPRFSWMIRAVGPLAVLIYASIAAAFYFRFHVGSEISMVHFLQLAFVSIFLVGLFVTSPPIVMAMLSKNLDRETRDVLLILQFGHLGVSVLYLGLILWIFEIGDSIPLGNIKFPISPQFLGVMMALFVFSILGPYISGWKRSCRWNVKLLEKERSWLDELLEVLDFPTPGLYVPKLQKILDRIKDDDMIFGQDGELNRIKSLYDADSIRLDPRFCYSDFLTRLQDRIAENIDQFKELGDERENIKETARIYAEAYRIRRDEIVALIETEGKFRPKLWIALALILTPIIGQVLANLIDWILKVMIESNLGGLIT